LGEKATSQVNELNAKVMTSSITAAVIPAAIPKKEEADIDTPMKTPDNVSKEELLDVLQKMNRKVKALTSQRTQLAERCKAAETDRTRLLTLIQDEILNGDVSLEEGKDQIAQLQVAWRAADERNSMALQSLQNEYKKVAMQGQGDIAMVKELVEKESEARAEGIRAQAVAEAMATGNEAWEEMRQQMVLRQREESAMLRQQLHEQYDLQLAQQEEDFRRQLAEEVAKARAEQSGTAVSVPPGGEDAEALKAKHREDMDKLKAAAAAQLNNFKKKVATARSAELEKLKLKHDEDAEARTTAKLEALKIAHQAEIESLRAQLSTESSDQVQKELISFKEKALKVRNDLALAHKAELERVKSEMEQSSALSQSEQVAALKQDYEAELSRVREEAQITLTNQIEQTRLDLDKQLSKVMNERLKEQQETHREEMDRLLSVSSEQLSAVERDADLLAEKLSAAETELQAAKAEFESSKTATSQQLESIKAEHAAEKAANEAAVRQEMEEKQLLIIGDANSSAAMEIQKRLNDSIAAHNEELENVLTAAAAEKENLKAEMEESLNQKLLETAAMAADKTAEEVALVRLQLEAEIAKQRQDLEAAKEAEVQKLKDEAEAVSARALDLSGGVAEAQKKLDEAIFTHKQELENVLSKAAAEKDSLKAQLEQSFNLQLMESVTAANNKAAEELLSVRMQLEAEIAKQRQDLENAKETEVQKWKEEAEAVSARALDLSDRVAEGQRVLQDNIAAHQQQLEKVLNDSVADREKLKTTLDHSFHQQLLETVATVKLKAAEEVASVRKELEAEIAKQSQDLENAKEAEIRKVREDADAAAARAFEQVEGIASSKLEALRSQLSQQISESQWKAQELAGDLAQAKRQQESLEGELEDLKAKAAAAEQDKASILAAAKDGEESSDQKLDDALTQQRASFEEQTKLTKDRYTKEMQEVDKMLREASEARDHAENNLSNRSQELASLREALSSAQQKVQNSNESAKKIEKARLAEVTILKQQHQAELNRFNQHMAETQHDSELKLSEANTARSEVESKADALHTAVQAARDALEAMKQEHAAELSSIHDVFTKQLSESKQMTEASAAEALKLSSTSAEVEQQYASLLVQHQELAVKFSNLEEKLLALSSETTSQVEVVIAEKQALATELSKSIDIIGAMKANHINELETLTLKSATMQQQSDDVRLALQSRINELETRNVESQKASTEELAMLRQMAGDAEREIAMVTANHERDLVALQEKLRSDQSIVADRFTEQARQEMLAVKDAEIAIVKAEYEEKLVASAKKNNAAVELVKKMKAATAQKIQVITQERTEAEEQMQREKVELEAQLRADFESKLQFYSAESEAKDEKIKMLTETHDISMNKLKCDSAAAIEIIRSEHETQLSALRQELVDAAEKINAQAGSISEGVQAEFMQKLQMIEANHAQALQAMEAEKQEALVAANVEKEAAVAAVSIEYDGALAKLVAEKIEMQEKAQENLDKRLKEQSEQNLTQIEGLTKTMEAHVDKLKQHFQEKMAAVEAGHKKMVKELEDQLKAREDQLAKLVGQVKASTTETSTLRDEKESIHNKLKSEAVVQQALRKKLEDMQKALSESQSTATAASTLLTQQHAEAEKERDSLREQLKTAMLERNSAKNKVEELSGKLSALGSNLSAMLDEKKDLDERVQNAMKQEAKLRATESELTSLRDQINTFKLEQTKNRSLLEKLQAEKEASEQKHGQRTALAGMLEEQLAELNEKNADANAKLEAALYDLSAKDEDIEAIKEKLENAEKALADTQNANRKATESFAIAQRGAEGKKQVESLQREIQSLQQQMSKKSAAAQRLIQEREAECIELRKTNKFLSQEVDKGSLSDRRIFELAAQQSNRESVASIEIEIRDKVVERLTEKLVAKDGDLASAEFQVQKIDNQVAELSRVRRREDVNLDYLKGIIVQYLSKPPGSTERGALLPVLATLLQFDDNDYKTIEKGKDKLSWWGTVAPIFIEAPAPAPAPSMLPVEQISPLLSAEVTGGSAEVTISSTSTSYSPQGRTKSSLEF
jgi:hypothetical protein